MELSTVDASYAQLQTESQQTVAALTTLAGKLQAAAATGDPNVREWMLDLKEIALGVQGEQNETTTLLQNVHAYLDQHVAQASPQTAYPAQQQAPGGGGLQRFLGGGFGRAIASGAGFSLGNDLINKIL